MGPVELRLTPIEAQSAGLNERFASLEVCLLARIQSAVADARVEMVRWVVALWAAMTVTFIGIALGLVRALGS